MVNERLAERFAEKLEQMRIGSGSFVTPSLVFHGAGSQEHEGAGWLLAGYSDMAVGQNPGNSR